MDTNTKTWSKSRACCMLGSIRSVHYVVIHFKDATIFFKMYEKPLTRCPMLCTGQSVKKVAASLYRAVCF